MELLAHTRIKGNKIYIRFTHNGSRSERAFPGNNENTRRNRAAAEALCERIDIEIRNRLFNANEIFGNESKPTNFEVFAKDWFENLDPGLAVSTVDGFKTHVFFHLIPDLGKYLISDIKNQVLKDFIKNLKTKNISDRTVCNIVGTLKMILLEALDEKIISENPFTRKVKKLIPKKKKPGADPYILEEQYMILDYFKKKSPKDTCLFAMNFFTGMRLSELVGIRWSDIDMQNMEIKIQHSITHGVERNSLKTQESRIIEIIPDLVPFIEAHKPFTFMNDKGYMFLNAAGNPYMFPSQDIKKKLKPACKALNLRYRSPGQMRHSFAVRMIEEGQSLNWIAHMMGHVDLQMITTTYGTIINRNRDKLRYRPIQSDTHLQQNSF